MLPIVQLNKSRQQSELRLNQALVDFQTICMKTKQKWTVLDVFQSSMLDQTTSNCAIKAGNRSKNKNSFHRKFSDIKTDHQISHALPIIKKSENFLRQRNRVNTQVVSKTEINVLLPTPQRLLN
jgi:hypothetical protein